MILAARLGVAAAALFCWEVAARRAGSLLLPRVGDTASAMVDALGSRWFWSALAISHTALGVGFLAAAIVGMSAGLWLGHFPRAAHWFEPHLQLLQVLPTSAIIPLVVMAGGLNLAARAFVVFSFAVPVVAATVQAGMRSVDARWVEMARAFGSTRAQVFWRVEVPAVRPALITALRLGLARAFSGMVVGEMVLMATGIGRLFLQFQSDFDAAGIYALALLVVLEAVLLTRLADGLERRLIGRTLQWAVQ